MAKKTTRTSDTRHDEIEGLLGDVLDVQPLDELIAPLLDAALDIAQEPHPRYDDLRAALAPVLRARGDRERRGFACRRVLLSRSSRSSACSKLR